MQKNFSRTLKDSLWYRAGELGSEDRLMTGKLMMIFKEIITTLGKTQCIVLRFQISALNFKPKGFTSNKALYLLF